jgi:hypothetical protein
MNHRRPLFSAAALLAVVAAGLPSPAHGQFGVAPRVGTLGLGGEVAIELSPRWVLRGGAGISKVSMSTDFNDVPVVLGAPDFWYNVGLDYYLNGAFRIGGGLLFKPDDPSIRGDFNGPVSIGGVLLTPQQIGSMTGTVEMDTEAAYALIGFGRHVAEGVGLFVDLGAAIFGKSQVALQAEGGTYPQDELDQLLVAEARNFENDMKRYFEVWPILSIGIRIGIGY